MDRNKRIIRKEEEPRTDQDTETGPDFEAENSPGTDNTQEEEPVRDSDNSSAQEFKNYKEKLYDKIPISLKALDIIIYILITLLVLMLAYFIIRRYI